MAIDASIVGGLKQFQPESPIDNYGKMMTLQNLMQKSQMGDFELQEAQTKRRNTNSIADLYQQNVAADGTVNRQGIYSGAAQRGLGNQIAGIQKGFNEQDKAANEAKKAQLEGVVQKLEVGGRLLGGVTDQASYDSARTAAQGYGLDVSRMPPQYDPAFVAGKLKESLSASDRFKQEHQNLVFGETQLHNRATEAGAAATLANTAQTAQMVDSRERDKAELGKNPAGYRRLPDGTMQAIPGGPADLKINAAGVAKVSDAKEVLSLLDEVDKLLPNATGSYLGAGYDKVAGALGMGTQGAENGAKLKAIEGALIAKMPKMSGPQSDKDVLLYRQMAGQVGDETIPVSRRQAASAMIRKLNERYEGVPEGSSQPAEAKAAAPKSGLVQDGYKFMGGDPSKPTSWQKVGS